MCNSWKPNEKPEVGMSWWSESSQKGSHLYEFPKAVLTKYNKQGALKIETYSLPVLEARSLKSRCQQDHASPDLGESLSWPVPVPGGGHQSLVFLNLQLFTIIPVSAITSCFCSPCVFLSSPLMDTNHTGLGSAIMNLSE